MGTAYDSPTGKEDSYHRNELTIFKHTEAGVPGRAWRVRLQDFVIFRYIVGSDVDRRGFYLPPAELHWGLAGVPEQLETDRENCYWEIEKFIRLGLEANPNILDCLYSPLVETCTPFAAQLIEMRHSFPSRQIHRTCNSQALSQFRELEQDLRNERGIRWKARNASDPPAAVWYRHIEGRLRPGSSRRTP
jgi:hypothetical protein